MRNWYLISIENLRNIPNFNDTFISNFIKMCIVGDKNSIWFNGNYGCNHLNISDNNISYNGKPIYYAKNQFGGTSPTDCGQVILANCSGMYINGQGCNNVTMGIALAFCTENQVHQNILRDNERAIFLYHFNNMNTLTDNQLYGNTYGIFLSFAYKNNIFDNVLDSNTYGIYFNYSGNNIVMGNVVSSSSGYGIFAVFSNANMICHNSIESNANQAYDGSGNHWNLP